MSLDSICQIASDHEFLEPTYWLVAGLEWREGAALAEAALAVAPSLIPRGALGRNADQVLGCADLCATSHGVRVVFLSDLTRMVTASGTSWSEIGVDWHASLRELESGPYPGMFLTINERAHLVICDPTAERDEVESRSGYDWLAYERELVRSAVTAKLDADWPAYIRRLIGSGRVRRAS